MSPETANQPEEQAQNPPAGATASQPAAHSPMERARFSLPRGAVYFFLVISLLALAASVLLWQRLSTIQEQLARQSADSGAHAVEARALARQAQDLSRETAVRQAVTEARLSEVALQRSQLEELIQSLSRSRD